MGKGVVFLLVLVFLTASCIIVAKPVFSSAVVAEDSWVSKTPMPMARKSLGVVVIDGKIYAIGGFPDLNNNDEYDPATDTWNSKAAMPTPRYNFAIAVYQNKIYCIGGMVSNRSGFGTSYTGAIEVYDPATDKWEIKEPMLKPRAQLEANVVNGKIYLIGGRTGGQNSTVSLNEVYDPETESWTTKASMPYPVVHYASAIVHNKIYILGGQDEFNETMNLAVNQIYDTETDTWSFGASLPTVVWLSAAGATSGVFAPQRIYVIGGQPGNSGGATDITQVYNPENDSWSVGASMPTARFDLALAVVNDTLYAIGGTDHYILPSEEANAENEMYTPIGYGTPESSYVPPADSTPPEITVLSPENKTYTSSNVSLAFTVNKPAVWMGYSLDGQETVTVTGNTTLSGLASGLHNVTVYAKDAFENTGTSETITFSIAKETETFPTTWVAAAAATIAIGSVSLAAYHTKRKNKKQKTQT